MRAWVDPEHGQDPAYSLPIQPLVEIALIGQINDPQHPYKSLQTAIDAVHAQLLLQFTSGATTQGVVYALPGLYGAHGGGSSGDVFPILMRDRVHVRGLGARRSTIRGTTTTTTPAANTVPTFWPVDLPASNPPHAFGASIQAEVLIDYGVSGVRNVGSFWGPGANGVGLPWKSQGDSAELLDGFSFEGGDVQVLVSSSFASPEALSGKITNCVFDLCHDWKVRPDSALSVSGPSFGVMLTKNLRQGTSVLGYLEQNFLIANNTFAFARFVEGGQSALAGSKFNAVGIIDVTNPCFGVFCNTHPELLGLGSPIIANNLFRTPPSMGQVRAMLGIDDTDVQTNDGTSFLASNAFAFTTAASAKSNHNGTSSPGFYSRPVVPTKTLDPGPGDFLLNYAGGSAGPSAPTPVPAIPIWDGSAASGQIDPGFVGEYLSSFITATGTIPWVLDWRLMPYSALKDRGIFTRVSTTDLRPVFSASNGAIIIDPPCQELASFQWDGEGYGNPRIVGGLIDIGFDEIDSLIACGSWGNHSNSHNLPSTVLQPSAVQGRPDRIFISDNQFSGRPCNIHGAGSVPLNPPSAWMRPPETLATPVLNTAFPLLPVERKTRYIRFNDSGTTPTGPAGSGGWSLALVQKLFTFGVLPPGSPPPPKFAQASLTDLESAIVPPGGTVAHPDLYFGFQAELLLLDGVTTWWSNLQSEYR